MKKVSFLLIIVSFIASFNVYGSLQYWDNPKIIEKASDEISFSQPNVIITEKSPLIFYVRSGRDFSEILFREQVDYYKLTRPISVSGKIKKPRGFIPEYDVFYYNKTIYIAYLLENGRIAIKESDDYGKTWEKLSIFESGKPFIFYPKLYIHDGALLLFYHTESEGRRIDFFVTSSIDMGKSWSIPVQVAVGFAGSFFPATVSIDKNLYVVWSSRPFEEKGMPIFHIYASISGDGGKSWGSPIKLTENEKGENIKPVVVTKDGIIEIYWQSDRSSVWSLYSRKFDRSLNPVSDVFKITDQPLNCINPVLLEGRDKTIFYLSERGGGRGIYASVQNDSEFSEFGPLGNIKGDITEYFPYLYSDKLFVTYLDSSGLWYLGPDVSVSEVKIIKAPGMYVGKNGFELKFIPPADPNGIKGIMYRLTDDPENIPDIINFQIHEKHRTKPHQYTLPIIPEKEGVFYFKIRAIDGAGNISPVKTIKFVVDLTPPSPPEFSPLAVDNRGFLPDNSPILSWRFSEKDVVGFNYVLSRRPVHIKEPSIKIKNTRIKFSNLDGGVWYFNIASVDRAGNLSDTKTLKFRLYPLKTKGIVEEKVEVKKEVSKPQIKKPPVKWIISFFKPSGEPILNLVLYVLLFSLVFTISVVFSEVVYRFIIRKRRLEMGSLFEEKKRFKFGLKLKFSLLIIGLILILTIGISSVLTSFTVKQERRALALQMKERAVLSIENLTNVAREGILNNDELLLLSIIRKTMQNTDIKYGMILDNSGRVIAHSDLKMKDRILSDDITIEMMQTNQLLIIPDFNPDALQQIYHVGMPINFAGKRIGTARIGYSTESIFKAIAELRKNNIYTTLFVTMATILIGLIGAITMATLTIKPLNVLAKGVRIVGTGRLDYKIYVKSRDEIGMVASEFNKMTEKLLEYQKELEKRAKLDEQLEIARNIQQDLIPTEGIENEWLGISGFYKAASGVGGDYYDYIEIEPLKYGLIMSDVSGKGIPASLMMMMIRSIFKSLIKTGVTKTSELVTLMNATLASDISSDRFATLLFGTFDVRKKIFSYTNAGYGPLLVYRNKKQKCELIESEKGSVPIGVMDDMKYEEESALRMNAGDVLIMFTDGIHEARNDKNEEFGLERLIKIVPDFCRSNSSEIASGIINEVLSFIGSAEQYDDMTLLVMKLRR